jgi:murein DD-endopeptidase MepM/ murein hydrolase activator NlpD
VTRLGWWLLFGFLAIIGVFALIVRQGGGPRIDRLPSSPATPAPAPSPATPAPAPSPAPVAAGRLVIPVSGMLAGQLTDSWGDARGDGTREHHAIDIVAPRGAPVVAAAGGTVEKIFESEAGGHTVYVRRTDPAWVDYYAHLDSYAPGLAEGMKLTQGQLLGAVGSTGDASPDAPHLHYEIKQMAPGEKWWQGTDIDPYPILAGKAPAR